MAYSGIYENDARSRLECIAKDKSGFARLHREILELNKWADRIGPMDSYFPKTSPVYEQIDAFLGQFADFTILKDESLMFRMLLRFNQKRKRISKELSLVDIADILIENSYSPNLQEALSHAEFSIGTPYHVRREIGIHIYSWNRQVADGKPGGFFLEKDFRPL